MKEFWHKMKLSFKQHWGQFMVEGKECINEFKNPETRKKQIPNLFTASRLFAPFFIIPSALLGNLPLTAIFVTSFALTDAADGYFARKYNATSEFGRKLDALTDKLFAASLLIPLIVVSPALLTVLTLEAVISGVNVYSQLSNNTPKTEFIGKIKTAGLSGTILLNYIALLANVPTIALNISLYSTVALQMLTSAKYLDVLSTKEREKGKQEKLQETIELELLTNGCNESVKSLELGESAPIEVDKTIETPAIQPSSSERVKQLREYREQLLHQEKEEEPVQLKIGSQK